jgi:hypothetical protein
MLLDTMAAADAQTTMMTRKRCVSVAKRKKRSGKRHSASSKATALKTPKILTIRNSTSGVTTTPTMRKRCVRLARRRRRSGKRNCADSKVMEGVMIQTLTMISSTSANPRSMADGTMTMTTEATRADVNNRRAMALEGTVRRAVGMASRAASMADKNNLAMVDKRSLATAGKSNLAMADKRNPGMVDVVVETMRRLTSMASVADAIKAVDTRLSNLWSQISTYVRTRELSGERLCGYVVAI